VLGELKSITRDNYSIFVVAKIEMTGRDGVPSAMRFDKAEGTWMMTQFQLLATES